MCRDPWIGGLHESRATISKARRNRVCRNANASNLTRPVAFSDGKNKFFFWAPAKGIHN